MEWAHCAGCSPAPKFLNDGQAFYGNSYEKLAYVCLPRGAILLLSAAAGPVETEFGTHLIYVESCNKPENTWKKLYDDIVDNVTGKGEEKK